jgi:hypothetical protein
MANFYARNAALLAKTETTYGTDPVPTGAANAILVTNLSVKPAIESVDRNLIRPFLGGSEQLVGNTAVDCTFGVELSGSGTAGTAPAWGPLLRACGFAEVTTALSRVDYTPISTAFESITLYYFAGGVQHVVRGARGTVELGLGIGERPLLNFSFKGIDGGMTAAALPSVTLSAFKTPVVITDPNAGDLTLGCTYAAGALVGGVIQKSRGLKLNVGNDVQYIPFLGGDTVDIVQRQVSGSFALDLPAADRVAFYSAVKANSLQGMGFVYGTVAGGKILIHAPKVQLTEPTFEEVNGALLAGYQLRAVPDPAGTGNDELRIVAL